MKKLCLIILLSVTSLFALAQNEPEKNYRNYITFNPFQFIDNTFAMAYERFISNDQSLSLEAGAIYEEEYREGFYGEFQYRYFIHDDVLWTDNNLKIFFSPYLQYKYVEENESYWGIDEMKEVEYKINSYGAGILVGLKLTIIERLVFDVYLGGGIRRTNDFRSEGDEYYYDGVWDAGYNGIAPKAGM
ncbi:MAG: hypothetical protein ACOC2E_07080, partial [Bacteroidota bacterium]